jgi:nitrogen fixation protein NifU and related proteins
MSEELYQEQIIQWSKKADHAAHLDTLNCSCTFNNPMCGDRVSVELLVSGGQIKAAAFQIRGCLLSKASTSILNESLKGKTLDQVKKTGADLEHALKSSAGGPECFPKEYRMFYPVRTRKSRHSCVMLPFEAVMKAFSQYIEENRFERNDI